MSMMSLGSIKKLRHMFYFHVGKMVGMFMIFLSSDYQEAASAIIVISFLIKYFPTSLLYSVKSYWHRHFPPKPRLLTSEEYFEEGARETKAALDDLRKYCSSPDCAQWRIMLKLNDSKRFAGFVEGDSHLSDDEVLDYEAYAFSLERNLKPNNRMSSTREDLEISEDDSSASEDDI
ncbi:Nuclear envelope integral membrane protein 1a [Eumeta japonica]|uniref:Nuclear envelope integral membrane protein 1a n=1 Tax=Eumeta variegata TaxID=151549 RepID=A0A4C1XER5_EUMVA|nr:Nuclear envelope integral membrane protein 1a [Eumeta japonica]